jgi:hypothetical protein
VGTERNATLCELASRRKQARAGGGGGGALVPVVGGGSSAAPAAAVPPPPAAAAAIAAAGVKAGTATVPAAGAGELFTTMPPGTERCNPLPCGEDKATAVLVMFISGRAGGEVNLFAKLNIH